MLGASVLFTIDSANAQWGLTGNPGATNTSILGVIAQSLPAEVQAHISETPSAQGEGRLGVSLADMQGLLLVGVKAVDASNRALQTEVAELKVTVKKS